MKLGYFSKFLIKFALCAFIFFITLLLSKVNIIDYSKVEEVLNKNINILNIASKLNIYEEANYIEVGVNNNYIITKSDDSYIIESPNLDYITPIKSGVIIYKDKNTIRIQSIDDLIFEYSNIDSEKHIYEYVNKDDILSYHNTCIVKVYQDGEVIDYFNTF